MADQIERQWRKHANWLTKIITSDRGDFNDRRQILCPFRGTFRTAQNPRTLLLSVASFTFSLHSQVNPNRTHFETLALVQFLFCTAALALGHLQSQSLRSHSARSASLSRKLCIWAFRVLPEELVEKSKPCPLDPSADGCGSFCTPAEERWGLATGQLRHKTSHSVSF